MNNVTVTVSVCCIFLRLPIFMSPEPRRVQDYRSTIYHVKESRGEEAN